MKFLDGIHLEIGTGPPLEIDFKRSESEILPVYRSIHRNFLSPFIPSHGIFQKGQPQLIMAFLLASHSPVALSPQSSKKLIHTVVPSQTSAYISGSSLTQLLLLQLTDTSSIPVIKSNGTSTYKLFL